MRLADRFSRRVRGYAKAHQITVIDWGAGERKHCNCRRAFEDDQGQAGTVSHPCWPRASRRMGCGEELSHRTKEADAIRKPLFISHPGSGLGAHRDQGQRPSSISARVMLNDHEYVACQADQADIRFSKEGGSVANFEPGA
jgi:hypothetical protein